MKLALFETMTNKMNTKAEAKKLTAEQEFQMQHPSYLRKVTAYFLILGLLVTALAAMLATTKAVLLTFALMMIPAVVAQASRRRACLHALYALLLVGLFMCLLLFDLKVFLILEIVALVLGLLAIVGSHFFGLNDK